MKKIFYYTYNTYDSEICMNRFQIHINQTQEEQSSKEEDAKRLFPSSFEILSPGHSRVASW